MNKTIQQRPIRLRLEYRWTIQPENHLPENSGSWTHEQKLEWLKEDIANNPYDWMPDVLPEIKEDEE